MGRDLTLYVWCRHRYEPIRKTKHSLNVHLVHLSNACLFLKISGLVLDKCEIERRNVKTKLTAPLEFSAVSDESYR